VLQDAPAVPSTPASARKATLGAKSGAKPFGGKLAPELGAKSALGAKDDDVLNSRAKPASDGAFGGKPPGGGKDHSGTSPLGVNVGGNASAGGNSGASSPAGGGSSVGGNSSFGVSSLELPRSLFEEDVLNSPARPIENDTFTIRGRSKGA